MVTRPIQHRLDEVESSSWELPQIHFHVSLVCHMAALTCLSEILQVKGTKELV